MITDIVQIAIQRNEEARRDTMGFAYYGKRHYFSELATVRLSLGRQLGHTTAIRELAKPWDMIISPTLDTIKSSEFDPRILAYSVAQLGYSPRGKYVRCKRIWVDNFQYCYTKRYATKRYATKLDFSTMLYDLFGVDEDQTFIFLG